MAVLPVLAAAAILAQAFTADLTDRLIADTARALAAPNGPMRGKPLGAFATAQGQAQAFETDFQQGAFRRRYVVLIRPTDPARGPLSVMLTSNTRVDQLAAANGDTPPVFVDLDSCNRHATLALLPGTPSFEELRDLIVQRLADPAGPVSSTDHPAGEGCAYGQFITPGVRR